MVGVFRLRSRIHSVILNEAGSSQSELPAKSKDPYSQILGSSAARSSFRELDRVVRIPFGCTDRVCWVGVLRLRSRIRMRESGRSAQDDRRQDSALYQSCGFIYVELALARTAEGGCPHMDAAVPVHY